VTPSESPAPDALVFEHLQRRSVTNDAIRLIKEMILSGRLGPGDRLPAERELSEAMGVSRPTIREAIRSLIAMHILEARHGAGTFVSSLSIEELLRPLQFVFALSESGLQELFEVRLLLEPGAAALAAERTTEAEIAAMRECVERTRREGSDIQRLLELDVELHRMISEGSRNDLLINMLASISALAVESRKITVELAGVPTHTIRDQAAIVEAIAARDPVAAADHMREHITSLREAALAEEADATGGYAARASEGGKSSLSQK
jgi:GntR family transcriptional regulator, transcriptional repressor for pyruvate dehydrogenase complex